MATKISPIEYTEEFKSITRDGKEERNPNFEKLTIGKFSERKGGGKSAPVTYKGKSAYIQTPPMWAPWGVSAFIAEKGKGDISKQEETDKEKPPSLTISLSFRGMEDDPDKKMKIFKKFLLDLDNAIVDKAKNRKKEWGLVDADEEGKPILMADKEVRKHMKGSARYSKDTESEQPPVLRCKVLPGAYGTKFYDSNAKKIAQTDIHSGSQVILLLCISSIWYKDNMFNIVYEAIQCVYLGGGIPDECIIPIPGQKRVRDDDDEGDESHESKKPRLENDTE